jgi:hypothetical protein
MHAKCGHVQGVCSALASDLVPSAWPKRSRHHVVPCSALSTELAAASVPVSFRFYSTLRRPTYTTGAYCCIVTISCGHERCLSPTPQHAPITYDNDNKHNTHHSVTIPFSSIRYNSAAVIHAVESHPVHHTVQAAAPPNSSTAFQNIFFTCCDRLHAGSHI